MPDDDDQGTDDIRTLRQAANEGRQAKAEMDVMKREVAFLKAGIDTDSKLGSMLFKTYDGELTKEALTAEAAEIGLTPGQAKTEPAEDANTDEPSEDQLRQQQRRQALATDSNAGTQDDANEDPLVTAKKAWDAQRAEGHPAEVAAAAYLNEVLKGAQAGDKRVLLPER